MDTSLHGLMADPDLAASFDIVRRTETLLKGRAVITATEETAVGVVQPATPRELERLPEADRVKSTIVVFTDCPLLVGDDTSDRVADGIRWRGELYTVTAVENWQDYGFFKALAQKESL